MEINAVFRRSDPLMVAIEQRFKECIGNGPFKSVAFADIALLLCHQKADELARRTQIGRVVKQQRFQFGRQMDIFRVDDPDESLILNALIEEALHIKRDAVIVAFVVLVASTQHHVDDHGTNAKLVILGHAHRPNQMVEKEALFQLVPKPENLEPLIVVQPVDQCL